MSEQAGRYAPGQVRDAILQVMRLTSDGLTAKQIAERVAQINGPTAESSVRSFLGLNTPELFIKERRGVYRLTPDSDRSLEPMLPGIVTWEEPFRFGAATLVHGDCFDWLAARPDSSIHAVVTDPPYGLQEYTPTEQRKLRSGRGGVWRIPPSFDGHTRSPLPRFTTLNDAQKAYLREFFMTWTRLLMPKLVPGANVMVASNPLLSHIVAGAMADAGLERRGDIVRLVMTMRGGDRPKGAHEEFADVSVLPRSMWEPWVLFRNPLEGRGTGQPAQVVYRWIPPEVRSIAIRRRDQVRSDATYGKGNGAASELEAAGVVASTGTERAATRRGHRRRSVRRIRLYARCRRGIRLCVDRHRERSALLPHGDGGNSRFGAAPGGGNGVTYLRYSQLSRSLATPWRCSVAVRVPNSLRGFRLKSSVVTCAK